MAEQCKVRTALHRNDADADSLGPDYLKNVKKWLDSHPNEVLTFVFTNPENQSPKDVWHPAFVNSGIAPLAYVPPSKPMKQSDWPTLGQMIDSGKRVVVFMDSGADNGGVDYILPEFQMVSVAS